MNVRVGYNKWVGRTLIILSVINLVLFLLLVLVGEYTFKTGVPALIMLGIGILHLRKPYFEFDGQQISVPNLLTGFRKNYVLDRPEDIEIRENRIFIRQKKISIYHWYANHNDWQQFLASVQETKRAIR